ncbi:MAG: hypothetical protein ACRD3D_11935 [Terriglobia bacterium]
MTAKAAAFCLIAALLVTASPATPTNLARPAKQSLIKLLLGSEVKPFVDLPASGEAAKVYFLPSSGKKKTDERGIDVRSLARSLRLKGVGVHAGEAAVVTDIRFERQSVEIQIGANGTGRRRGITDPLKLRSHPSTGPGSRISFRYQRPVSNADLEPDRFLGFMSRILDVGSIRQRIAQQGMPAGFKSAIDQRTVKVGMTYQMVLMAFGDPGQKKINESTTHLSETWFYLVAGHRWVIDFFDGKVVKVRVY